MGRLRLPLVLFAALSGTAAGNTLLPHDSRPESLDAGVVAIVVPPDTVDSGIPLTPAALVANFGDVDTGFPVTMLIGADYTSTVDIRLAAGTADTFAFGDWTPTANGAGAVTCYTGLAGDADPGNDTAHRVVVVVAPRSDVGVVEIRAPDPVVNSGDTVLPRALVKNCGAAVERYFDVRFSVDDGYFETVTIDELAPAAAVEVTFPPWQPAAGIYTAACSTMLGRDANPDNDRLLRTVTVRRRTALSVEPDTSVAVATGATLDVRLYAELDSDDPHPVGIEPVGDEAGWHLELVDAATGVPLPVEDGRAQLGTLTPFVRQGFLARLTAPGTVTGGALARTFVLRGSVLDDSAARDSALVTATFEPSFAAHNYPNPLRDSTSFVVSLPGDGTTTLRVYDRSGRLLATVLDAVAMRTGIHYLGWRALDRTGARIAPGTYQYVLLHDTGGQDLRFVGRLVVARD